jgi:hypothetical protein
MVKKLITNKERVKEMKDMTFARFLARNDANDN